MEGIITGASWLKGTWELSVVFLLFIVSLKLLLKRNIMLKNI